MASSSTSHGIFGQKLFDGKTKTIYSVIDQPGLVCIYRKDYHDSSGPILSIPGSRRSSIDSGFRFNQQSTRYNTSILNTDSSSKGILITSITTCVYEILREASIPTFYVAPHPQPDMFIAKKCTMIPILWVIRRLANETYVKRNPGITHGHRFIPPMIETYHKRLILEDADETFESDREDQFDDNDDSDLDECIASIWSYEQLLNANMNSENLKISQTDIECMYEISCTIFDILEHIWMVKKNCQLIDLKIEFGITTTATKEIVVANVYDIETWHILRTIQKMTSGGNDLIQENLLWMNNALRDILDLNINIPLTAKMVPRHNFKQQSTIDDNDEEKKPNTIISEYDHVDINNDNLSLDICSTPSITSRCIIVCSSLHDVENGQKIKTTLNEIYNIQCDIRLCSIHKSTQTILKFLSHYSHEHCRPTVFITLGNINTGLAMCLSSNSQYPIIHCSLMNNEKSNNLFDMNSFISHDTPLFTVVFTLSSAIQNVIQILAMNDWKLWAKQRGRRLKKYMDFITADQQLLKTQTIKTNSGILNNK